MSTKKGRKTDFTTTLGEDVEVNDSLLGRRIIVTREDDEGEVEEFEGLVDGRMEDEQFLVDFKNSKYLKKKKKEAELNAMEVVDLSKKNLWKLIDLKEGERSEDTYSVHIPTPMPKGGCPEGKELMKDFPQLEKLVWQRINVMWDTGNVFSGYIVRILDPPKVKVVYDDEDKEEIDLTETCWRLITPEYEHVEPKYLTAFRRKLHRKEYGESATTPLRRGRSQQATPTITPNLKPSLSAQELKDKEGNVVDSEKTRGQNKGNNKRGRPPSTLELEPESKRKVKQQETGKPLRSQQKQGETAGHRCQTRSGNGVLNGSSVRDGTNNYRSEERGVPNVEAPYEMLVDDKELKVIKFPGQHENVATYDMVLMLPGISKENVAVECGDFSVRVSIGARDGSSVWNRNYDTDMEIRDQNGVESEGTQEVRKYCIVLPEHIVPEATTAEVSPVGRLRIKCVAGELEFSENNR